MATTVGQVSNTAIVAHAHTDEVQAAQFRKDSGANVQLARISYQHTASFNF